MSGFAELLVIEPQGRVVKVILPRSLPSLSDSGEAFLHDYTHQHAEQGMHTVRSHDAQDQTGLDEVAPRELEGYGSRNKSPSIRESRLTTIQRGQL